jgi:hypothetical protein
MKLQKETAKKKFCTFVNFLRNLKQKIAVKRHTEHNREYVAHEEK